MPLEQKGYIIDILSITGGIEGNQMESLQWLQ